MKVKVKFPIIKPGGGVWPVGEVIDLDLESYDRHLAAGNVESLEVAQAVERAEAEVKRVRAEAEKAARDAETAARERAEQDIKRARDNATAERRGSPTKAA